jgi:ankyrin repeat protein
MSSMGFEAYYSNYLSAQRGKLFDSLEAGPYDSFATNVALLPKEAALNARNKCDGQWGRTLLHFAVRSGRLDTVQLLLELGYDPNSFDSSISLVTPLMEAVKISHVEISELLIEHGADLTICDINHENILHYCARFGR